MKAMYAIRMPRTFVLFIRNQSITFHRFLSDETRVKMSWKLRRYTLTSSSDAQGSRIALLERVGFDRSPISAFDNSRPLPGRRCTHCSTTCKIIPPDTGQGVGRSVEVSMNSSASGFLQRRMEFSGRGYIYGHWRGRGSFLVEL